MTKKISINTFCTILMVVNAILLFIVGGYPRERLSKANFCTVAPHMTVTLKEDTEVEYTARVYDDDVEVTGTVVLEAGSEHSTSGLFDTDIIRISDSIEYGEEVSYPDIVTIIDKIEDISPKRNNVLRRYSISYVVKLSSLTDEDIAALQPYIEQTERNNKNYEEYKESIKYWFLQPENIFLGFITTSLFTLINWFIYLRSKKTKVVHLILNIIALPWFIHLVMFVTSNLIYAH